MEKALSTEAGWLDLTVRYVGSFGIEKSQALLLDSKYSKLSLGETSSLVGESKYDNIRISQINNLVLENGYCDVNVELTKTHIQRKLWFIVQSRVFPQVLIFLKLTPVIWA